MLRLLRQWWSRRREQPQHASASAAAVELVAQGRLREAEDALRAACARRPHDAEAWHLLGYVLQHRGNTREAVDALERAAVAAPANPDALYSLSISYRAAGERRRAIATLERLTVLRPEWHVPWLTLGDMLAEGDDIDPARDMYRRALAAEPAAAEAHHNFGNLLLRCGLADEAIACYREAVALQPSFVRAYSNLLCALNYADGGNPEATRDAHFEFDARYARALAPPPSERWRPRAHGRIRIGYVSPDFRDHAVGRLVEPALRHHDRGRFELYCYSDVKQPDARTSRFRAYAAAWRDVASLDDEALAAQVRRDEIDILVDLAGHTEGNRLLAFARKPAPVQVTWIGYPNTTGLTAMDYRITDARADPPGLTDSLHSERLLRLPEVYLPCERPEERIDAGPPPCLARGCVTFGSFNTLMKLSARAIALWARVLLAVPGSRLLAITVPEGRTRERLREAFARHGIAADRLHLKGRLAHAEFLAAHAEVDLALDTFPYHGTTTTAHTLWMGIPLVTRVGATHVSRVGLSMLHNVGLGDLAAADDDEFVACAARLARDVPRLVALRKGLRERVERSALMDGPRFARHLDSAYVSIWEAFLSGPPPRSASAADPVKTRSAP